MKVVLTANTAWNLAHFRRPVIEDLLSDGHEVVALAPEGEGSQVLAQLGVRLRALRIDSKGMAPARDAQLIADFRKAFMQERPDVVLSYTIKNNIYGGMAARMLGVPFIPNVSGLGTAFLGIRWLEMLVVALYRCAFRPLSQVVFQNADDRDLFVSRRIVRREQTVLVPGSGIDLWHFRPTTMPPGPQVCFLMIARLLRDKGVMEYVEAARQVRHLHPEARFQLLGQVGVENRTAIDRATVAAWQAEGAIEYLGATDDVRPFISAANCVVLPSYREGTPRTLLEAAAMTRPLVASDVPGCREVVVDGYNGYLCRARDTGDLARAMVTVILAGPDERARLGLAGRKLIEDHFGHERVVKIYRQALAKAVSEREVRRRA